MNAMDRWEPPSRPTTTGRRPRPGPPPRAQRDDRLPEAINLAAGRIVIGFLFAIAGTGRPPTAWLLVGLPVICAALLLGAFVFRRWGFPLSRGIWAVDAVTVGAVTPLLVIATFAGAGSGAMLASERSIYVQTALAAIVAVGALTLYAWFRVESRHYAAALLPAALTPPSLALVYADFRTLSVAGSLTFVWLVAAIMTLTVHLINPRYASVLPLSAYVLYLVLALLLEPELTTLGGRPAPVLSMHPLLILLFASLPVLKEVVARSRVRQQRARSRRRYVPPEPEDAA